MFTLKPIQKEKKRQEEPAQPWKQLSNGRGVGLFPADVKNTLNCPPLTGLHCCVSKSEAEGAGSATYQQQEGGLGKSRQCLQPQPHELLHGLCVSRETLLGMFQVDQRPEINYGPYEHGEV